MKELVATEMMLPALAAEINAEHGAAVDATNQAVEHARRCGELLRQAKSQLQHGEWGGWIQSNCSFSDRTARAYMRIADRLPTLDEGKRQRVAEMPLRQALSEIAETVEPHVESSHLERARRFETVGGRLRREYLGLSAELDAMCEPRSKATMTEFLKLAAEAKDLEVRIQEHRLHCEREMGLCLRELQPYFDSKGRIRATSELEREHGLMLREIEEKARPFLLRGKGLRQSNVAAV